MSDVDRWHQCGASNRSLWAFVAALIGTLRSHRQFEGKGSGGAVKTYGWIISAFDSAVGRYANFTLSSTLLPTETSTLTDANHD